MNYASIIKKQSTIIAVSVFVMVIGIIGTSYALFMKVDQSEEQTVQSGSLIMQLSPYDGSTVISSNNTPIDDNEGMLTKGYSFSVTNNGTLPITYYIALYNNPDDTSTKLDYKYIKVSLDNGTPFLLSSITNKDSSDRSILKQNISLAPNKYDTHNIKVWIDEDTPETEIGKSLSLKIFAYGEVCEDGTCDGGTTISFADKLSSFAANDTINFASDDVDNNVRYIGKDPNNYVYFNCSDYSNQSDSTCEKWRIIGAFNNITKNDGTKEKLVKIVRSESIGYFSWDNKNATTGSESEYGKNDWTTARINYLLNPGHDSESVGGSLYYNAKSGTCYAGQNNATTSCDFTSSGLKNDSTRNAIQEVVWNLGQYDGSSNWNANEFYEAERGTSVYSGRQTTWTGKIGLMYASDYGYATAGGSTTNRLTCSSSNLSSLNDLADCTNNNYLHNDKSFWFLTTTSSDSYDSFVLAGSIYFNASFQASNIHPTLYLKSNISIASGDGSSSAPYQLKIS